MRRAHEMPFGAALSEDGVAFSLWAPGAKDISLVLDGAEHPLNDDGKGWRRASVTGARAGSRYQYKVDGGLLVPDPASRFQPDDVEGASVIVDPRAYDWTQTEWMGRPWEEAVIYEVHVGTATPEGTYAALEGKLDRLVELGITAIEIMPISDFPGRRNWGYDGVLPYAPEASYGTPDQLKHFVDAAHSRGVMVLLDVVYNHFGPSGNYLNAYAKQFFTTRHHTPWGEAINFEGRDGAVVREFFIHNALYWLDEFNMDGLRLDAVHSILDDSSQHVLGEMAERARASLPGRQIHLVLENEGNEARWLERKDDAPRLYTAQWDDDIHNCWHALMTGEDEGYYEDFADQPADRLGRALAEGFCYQGDASPHLGRPRGEPSGHLPPTAFVAFLQNHDQIGNRGFGERLAHMVPADELALARAGLLLAPQIPMLFMGEEWSASSPFLFFVDFADDPGLAKAVREGRRREFSKFKAFAGHEDDIPDPTDPATFERSRIDWDEARREPYADVWDETRELIALRRAEIVPLLRTPFLGGSFDLPHDRAVAVDWNFEGGTLRLVANFGDEPVEARVAAGERLIWRSRTASVEDGRIVLGRWNGAILVRGREQSA